MKLSLKKGSKIILNGAIIQVDRKVTIDLLNDATFLLEAHLIDAQAATTVSMQIYYLIQAMMKNPDRTDALIGATRTILSSMCCLDPTNSEVGLWREIIENLEERKLFKALKIADSLQGSREMGITNDGAA